MKRFETRGESWTLSSSFDELCSCLNDRKVAFRNRAGDCVREERDLAHTKSGVAGIMSISQCATAGSSLPFSGCAEVGVVDRQLASHHRNLQLTFAFLFTVSATLTIYFILYQVCCLILTIL